MKQLKTNSDYAELFKGLMDLAGVNPHEFELFSKRDEKLSAAR